VIAFTLLGAGSPMPDPIEPDRPPSPAEAALTAARAGVGALVLTHYVPAFPSGGGDGWKALAAEHFAGRIALGDDLHRAVIERGCS
jgi:ribonuclease Z